MIALAPFILAGAVAAGAHASGGGDIASAPELLIGSQVLGGTPYDGSGQGPVEYYRITLTQGDALTLDYGSLSNNPVRVCLYAPAVNDYTVGGARCLFVYGVNGKEKDEVHYAVPASGLYTLRFDPNPCCADMSYELTAYVRHFTATTVQAPSLVAVGHTATISGSVTGGATGAVQIRQLVGGTYRSVGVVSLTASGRFVFRWRAARRESVTIRIVYPGDAAHKASSRTIHIIVG